MLGLKNADPSVLNYELGLLKKDVLWFVYDCVSHEVILQGLSLIFEVDPFVPHIKVILPLAIVLHLCIVVAPVFVGQAPFSNFL